MDFGPQVGAKLRPCWAYVDLACLYACSLRVFLGLVFRPHDVYFSFHLADADDDDVCDVASHGSSERLFFQSALCVHFCILPCRLHL